MILLGLFETAGVFSIAPFVTLVLNPAMAHENEYLSFLYLKGGFNETSDFLLAVGVVMLILIGISNLFATFMKWQITFFVRLLGFRLETKLIRSYLGKDYFYFLNSNLSDLSKNILTEVERVMVGVIHPLLEIITKLVSTILIIILLILVDYKMAFSIATILGGTYGLIFLMIKNRQKKLGDLSTGVLGERYKLVEHMFSGIKEIKFRHFESIYEERYKKPARSYAVYLALNHIFASIPRYILEVIAFSTIVFLVILQIKAGNLGGEVLPIIAMYAFAAVKLLPALQLIYSSMTKLRFSLPILDIIIKDLDSSERSFSAPKGSMKFKDTITLNSVNYFYPNETNPALNDVNLKIGNRTTVAIVGLSGAGKSTLIDILLGLLKINSGSLRVDKTTIDTTNITFWQNSIGYVPQDIYLTDSSIASNIAFGIGEEDIDYKQVEKCIEMASLKEFIFNIPEGYKTLVGDRGVRLSGGQKQRIGIARALYRNPQVLILDEATSSLDGITEQEVLLALKAIKDKITIVMVTHRISSVKDCDVIYFMDKGRIIQSGTYDHLMQTNKKFKSMANQ